MKPRWSIFCDACRDCGGTLHRHYGRGYCARCYKRLHNKGVLGPDLPRRWSIWTDACVECGRTDRPHESRGICHACRQAHYRTSEGGRAAIQRYVESTEGRAVRHECTARYQRSDRGRRVTRRSARRRRDVEYDILVPVPLGYEDLVYEVFGARCAACGNADTVELDHHRPLQDGHGLLHNAVPLCRSCNAKKSRKAPEDFYDAWKFAEVAVLLWETRAEFDRRFEEEVSA